MRKKYLSALLFGALLFASAGTFTSCKDYDDDINNLQEQINTVKTSLDELTSKVNSLGAGVTGFKYENGKLIIETDKGTNFEATLPEVDGIKELTIKDGILYADGKEIGSVSGDVKVEGGKLYINGEVQDLEIGNKVVVVDNGDGTYTLTVDDKSYTLPKTVATNISVTLESNSNYNYTAGGYTYFTEFEAMSTNVDKSGIGISWGTAAGAIADWTGPKGAITAGQFLVGQINDVDIKVSPANTQLDGLKLQLVDTKGTPAPVIITASPKNQYIEDNTGSRATDSKGEWVLSIAMDNTVGANNMGTAFAVSKDGSNVSTSMANKTYALAVDGHLLTGYVFAIDTDTKATTSDKVTLSYDQTKVFYNGTAAKAGSGITNLGLNREYKLEYKRSDVYDYKFSISKEDQNDAEKYGITLENNVLKAGNNAAKQTINLDLTVVGVDGTLKTYSDTELANLTVGFGTVVTSADEIGKTTYKVAAGSLSSMVINLEDVFTSLTADEAVSLNAANTTWTLVDPESLNEFIVDKAQIKNNIAYFQDAACQVGVGFDDSSDNIKKIKYAKLTVNTSTLNKGAKPGDYTLVLNLKDDKLNEVKKVNIPVTITIPTFDEIFTKSAAWTEGVATMRLNKDGKGDFLTIYKTGVNISAANGLAVNFDPIKINGVDQPVLQLAGGNGNSTVITSTGNSFQITANVIDNNKHILRSTSAEAVYKIQGVEGFTVKSGKFDVKFATALDGAKLVYYVDGKEGTMTVNGPKGEFNYYQTDNDNLEQGVAIVLGGKATLVGIVNNVQLSENDWTYSFDAKAGNSAKATVDTDGKLKIENLATSASGNYTTEMTLIYQGIVSVGGSTVNSSVSTTLNVNN